MEVLQKQPYEELPFTFDFADVIPSGATVSAIDSIAAANCAVVSGSSNVTTGSNTTSGRSAQTKVSGGTSGESYKITCRVTDSNGHKHEHEGIVEVIEK
jgi:hypothetical protein